MSESPTPDFKRYHEFLLIAVGLLGGISFTGLVFILQSKDFVGTAYSNQSLIALVSPYPVGYYIRGLITLLAGIAVLSGMIGWISSFAIIDRRAQNPVVQRRLAHLADWCFTFDIGGFIFAIYSLLLPFTSIGSKLTLGLIFVVSVFTVLTLYWPRKKSDDEEETKVN